MQHCNCRWESATLFSLIFGGVCYFGRFVLRSLPVLESFYPTKIKVFLWMTLLLALILMTRCKLFIWLLLLPNWCFFCEKYTEDSWTVLFLLVFCGNIFRPLEDNKNHLLFFLMVLVLKKKAATLGDDCKSSWEISNYAKFASSLLFKCFVIISPL